MRLLRCVVVWARSAASSKLHIVHVVADDLGYNDVSWHNPRIKSPVLQSLVAAVSQVAGCSSPLAESYRASVARSATRWFLE